MVFHNTAAEFVLPLIRDFGYPFLFLIALLESSPFFGFIVPGQITAMLAGFFSNLGILSLSKALLLAGLGAILGDCLSYTLGRKYGFVLIEKFGKYVFFGREDYEATKDIMRAHLGKAIIIGRAHSLTRALAPFAAGATRIPFKKVIPFTIIAGILWAVVFVGLGYIFGKTYEIAANYISGAMFIIFIILFFPVYHIFKQMKRKEHLKRLLKEKGFKIKLNKLKD